MRARKARENMQPVQARENSSNPTKFVLQFSIRGTCHKSTATSKIKRSNGMCPAQKTLHSKTKATKAKKNICRWMLHEIIYEACVS